nr:hypothetical protein [Clostridia bacterium]
MIGKITGILCTVGFLYALVHGSTEAVGDAVMNGCRSAVELTISLVGMMGLWGGIMRVAEKSGVTAKFARLIRPLMKLIYPDAVKKHNGTEELAAAMTANLLGMGNAATPLAIQAMKKLRENDPDNDRASGDMVVFAVSACTPFTLLPATVITLRQAAGSADPTDVVLPIWLVSLTANLFAVILARLLTMGKR